MQNRTWYHTCDLSSDFYALLCAHAHCQGKDNPASFLALVSKGLFYLASRAHMHVPKTRARRHSWSLLLRCLGPILSHILIITMLCASSARCVLGASHKHTTAPSPLFQTLIPNMQSARLHAVLMLLAARPLHARQHAHQHDTGVRAPSQEPRSSLTPLCILCPCVDGALIT